MKQQLDYPHFEVIEHEGDNAGQTKFFSVITNTLFNKQIIDLDYHFNYAIIFLPDGEKIEGKVSSWNDYEESDMIQVKIDGVTYLTHSANVILESR